MKHIKVINEATELVPMLRALDTPVKREVFEEIIQDWRTMSEIEEKYGEEGKLALQFFEKTKLVDIQWQINENNQREKAYRSYYNSFHIHTQCPISEIKDVLTVAIMDENEFRKYEKSIVEALKEKDGTRYVGEIIEKMNISDTMLKSIVKRSEILDYKGQNIMYYEKK